MQKFSNKPENMGAEMLEGLVLAHQELVTLTADNIIVSKKLSEADRVTVVAFGALGNEPALSGFVGEGLLDAFVAGDLLAAPGPAACMKALGLADKGKGVLLVCANHTGDRLTANIVLKQAQKLGLNVALVEVHDDAAQADRAHLHERRGLCGCVPVCKVAAAAAACGKTLPEVAALAQHFADNMATIAVAAAGEQLAVGVGLHGEAGARLEPMLSADIVAAKLTEKLVADLAVRAGEKLLVILSGSGATTLMQQLVLFRAVYAKLSELGLSVAASYVGELQTLQEAAGFELCFAQLDDELLALWQAKCQAPYFKN